MRLARLSLGVGWLLMLTSCLVDDPPPFTPPNRTPPRLDYHNALPLLDQVISAKTGETIDFKVPVASEDAGDRLSAMLLLDYRGGPAGFLRAGPVPPSTLDDASRSVTLSFTVSNISKGCHRFTLRVTHERNIDVNGSPEVFDTSDLAEAYWWANIDVDPAQAGMLLGCPSASRGGT
jgi:hypothetical protein